MPIPARTACLVTTSPSARRPRTAPSRGAGSPLSVGRPSASHFWNPPSRIATSLGAEVAEHEPAARRGAHRRIVIDDDAVVAADPEPLHRRSEIGGRRQHVRRGVRAVADLVDVEEARAGDVRLRDIRRGRCGRSPACASWRRRRRGRPHRDAARAIRSKRARPLRARIGVRAPLPASWPRDGDDPPRQAQRPARFARRGGARLCAEPAARRALPGALRRARVHLAVPGDRPARFRASGDRLCARPRRSSRQEPEAVPRLVPQPWRLPRGRDRRHRPAAGRGDEAAWLRIGGYWYPRGGMPIDVFWQSGPPPEGLWLPDQGVAPYRGRG